MRFGCVLAATVVLGFTAACTRERRDRYLIPEGYAGWLCVSYGVPGAPPLPMEEGFRLVVFPPDGLVSTSSPALIGEGYMNEYLYYVGDHRRSMNVGKEMGGGYTEEGPDRSKGFAVKFWVSRDAKADSEKYVSGRDPRCGPFPNYASAGAS